LSEPGQGLSLSTGIGEMAFSFPLRRTLFKWGKNALQG
jgi:hypothetical protein